MGNLTVSKAIILGLIQGLTEFLPVSSSAHLAIAQKILSVQVPLTFDVLLHLATLLAVLTALDKKIIALIKGWRANFGILRTIAIATGVTAVFGFLLESKIDLLFDSLTLVGILLLANSLILLTNHPKFPKFRTSRGKGVWLGLSQSLSLFPGISRSGATITCGKILNFKPQKAFEISFLLYLPAVMGALILEIIKAPLSMGKIGILPVTSGFIIAFISGWAALKLLQRTIAKGKLWIFAPYCIILGILLVSV